MSREILNDHPWDAEEVAYQIQRGREKDIAKNKQDFPEGSSAKPAAPQELKLDPDIYEFVKGLNLEKLQSELRKREIVPKGDEKSLKVTLAQTLQAERESG